MELRSNSSRFYLFPGGLKAAVIFLEVNKSLSHETVQVNLVAKLQLWVSLQHDRDDHQQLQQKVYFVRYRIIFYKNVI